MYRCVYDDVIQKCLEGNKGLKDYVDNVINDQKRKENLRSRQGLWEKFSVNLV